MFLSKREMARRLGEFMKKKTTRRRKNVGSKKKDYYVVSAMERKA